MNCRHCISSQPTLAKFLSKKLLSRTKTKKELATFLAKKTLEYAKSKGKHLVVARESHCKATHKDDQEVADTKMILHAVDATADGAHEVCIHSSDTDVPLLAIRRCQEMCNNTSLLPEEVQIIVPSTSDASQKHLVQPGLHLYPCGVMQLLELT